MSKRIFIDDDAEEIWFAKAHEWFLYNAWSFARAEDGVFGGYDTEMAAECFMNFMKKGIQ